jgi:hypothetical protein
VLCTGNTEETREHLFLWCSFAKDCWNEIGILVDDSVEPIQNFDSFRAQLNVPFFMEVIIIMSWSIWTIRNYAIFKDVEEGSQRCLDIFNKTFGLLLWCAKKKYFPQIESWLEHLV